MVMAALGTAWGFLKGVPREIYYAAAAALLLFGAYHKGGSDEKREWIAKLEQAELDAKLAAERAMREADSEAEIRAIAHAATQSTLRKAITDAERDNSNPIDAIISGLSAAD